jgi:hypothetical protein
MGTEWTATKHADWEVRWGYPPLIEVAGHPIVLRMCNTFECGEELKGNVS